MKYYVLKHSNEQNIVGDTPQSEGMKDSYISYADDSAFKMSPYEIPEFQPNFDAMLLSSKAKLTDWVDDPFGTTGPGMTVSKKFKNILTSHNLCKHEFYKVGILHKGSSIDNYWYMRIGEILEDTDCIDFHKTHFVSKPMFLWMDDKPIMLNVKDRLELQQAVKEQITSNPMFKVLPDTKLYLNKKFDKNMDLFYFGFSDMYIVSERLKLEIEKFNITAVEFKELGNYGLEIICE